MRYDFVIYSSRIYCTDIEIAIMGYKRRNTPAETDLDSGSDQQAE